MRNFSFLTLLAALLIVGCTEVTIEQSNPLTEINSLPDLTASFADEGKTRTFVEDSKYLRWHEADLITAFFGNTLNRQYKFKGKTSDNSGTFSLVPSGELGTGNDLSSIYAVYPYDENTTITDNGVISLTLPATQTYAENSFGKGANTMVAVTESAEDTFLSFKNACGYLKLKLYGDNVTIANIEVKGNNEEKIAGSATATMEFGGVPTIAMNDEATTSVTLDCGEGVSIGTTADMATEFWIVLPETTFEGGITITATNTDGAVFSKSTTNTVVITRNDIQPMVALKTEFATAKPANNEIWYTNGSTTEATAPLKTDVFGANIVSNTYDADKGCWIIEFDGDVMIIGANAFANIDSLESITIPDSVTTIGFSAFMGCDNLTIITIGEGVNSIGGQAFYNCNNLKRVNIYNISTLCNIDHGTNTSLFRYSSKLFLNGVEITKLEIPSDVTQIKPYAFALCSNIQSVIIPDSITSLGKGAFTGCVNLSDVFIGNGITTIGDYAFVNCTSLTNIAMSSSITSIGIHAFDGCASLTTISIPDSITKIGDYAFANCSYLSLVDLPDEVTEIGCNAFDNCSSLVQITLPAKITSIGDEAFINCNRLSIVNIKDLSTWCNVDLGTKYSSPFNYAEKVYFNGVNTTEISLSGNISKIKPYVFYGCKVITNITIPSSIVNIGLSAFGGCSSLTNITIPESVTSIGASAFMDCTSLTTVTIPSSITSIEAYTFIRCKNLNEVIIGKGVNSIGYYAFYNCSSLKSVYCKSLTPPTIDTHGLVSDIIVYVPSDSVDEYMVADGWSNYANSIVGYDFE